MNYFRTALLLAVLTALFVGIGYLIGRQQGMIIAFFIALAMNMFAYWNSDKMVLRMHNAQEVDAQSAPEYYDIVRQLAANAQLPMPKTYVVYEEQPNAFATGRSPERAAVAATTGLLDKLSKEEIAGVMAHELAHIKNRDTLTMTIAATIGGAIGMLAQFGGLFGGGQSNNKQNPLGPIGLIVMMIVAPLAAALIQMAISRAREYEADKLGAEICRRPLWLASALQKISSAAHAIPNVQAERHPATAHMFIVNPLSGARMDNLFSTHPHMENRLAALAEIARGMGQDPGQANSPQDGHSEDGGQGPWTRGGRGEGGGPWS